MPNQISPGAVLTIEQMLLQLATYVEENVSPSTIVAQQMAVEGIQVTLINALSIVNAYAIQLVLSREYALLEGTVPGSLGLSISDLALVNNRLASMALVIANIYPLPLWITFNIANIQQGASALPALDLTSYFMQFDGETPPALSTTTFYTAAQSVSTAFQNANNYIGTQGSSVQLSGYDAVDRMVQSSADAANTVWNPVPPNLPRYTFSLGANLIQIWNSVIALPSILRVASLLLNDPSDSFLQNVNALRQLLLLLIDQTNQLVASFGVPTISPAPTLARLHASESLMDFAARTLGDYTQWEAIANINNLQPPYVATSRTLNGPLVAIPGDVLYLGTSAGSQVPLSNYNTAYLGSDIDFGSLDAPDIPWTGDFGLVSGYNNLLGALGRRVLTALGSLIFHSNYGSRLPAEIGNIRVAAEARLLSAYLQSALLSDPRIQTVSSLIAVPGINDSTVLTSVVIPYGQSSGSPFNLVLTPKGSS